MAIDVVERRQFQPRVTRRVSSAYLQQPPAFVQYIHPLGKIDWVVYAKPPFGGPAQALDYLGR